MNNISTILKNYSLKFFLKRINIKDAIIIACNLIILYINKISDYNLKVNTNDFLLSGLSFFIGQIILILNINNTNINWETFINKALDFTIIYMYIDHYLDDPNILEIDKQIKMENILSLINNEPININTDFRKIYICYTNLLNEDYHYYKQQMLKLFNIIISSVKIQSNPILSREIYKKASEEKGGETLITIYKLFDKDFNFFSYQSIYNLGAYIQIMDDIIDVSDDIKNNINTIATYDVKNYNYLDSLVCTTIKNIHLLPKKLKPLKILIIQCLIYTINRSSHFTLYLKRKVSKYNYFSKTNFVYLDKITTKDSIKKYIENELRKLLNYTIIDDIK